MEPTPVTRPRVVIESARPAAATAQALALADAGIDAVVCEGPDHHPGGCPLLTGDPCDLVASADAVLFDLDLDRLDDRQVLRALQTRHPDLPIVAEVPTATWRRRQADLSRCTVVVPFSVGHTRDAVVAAIGGEAPPEVAAPTG